MFSEMCARIFITQRKGIVVFHDFHREPWLVRDGDIRKDERALEWCRGTKVSGSGESRYRQLSAQDIVLGIKVAPRF